MHCFASLPKKEMLLMSGIEERASGLPNSAEWHLVTLWYAYSSWLADLAQSHTCNDACFQFFYAK